MNNVSIFVGALSLFSAGLWAFAGLSFWVPVSPGDDGRAFVLLILHLLGMIVGARGLLEKNRQEPMADNGRTGRKAL